jgi:hypothetical protein
MESPVTVFRSADEFASEDAASIRDMLADHGIEAQVVDDQAPGVPAGAWEVRVSAADQAQADELVARFSAAQDSADVNPSTELDLVTVFRSAGQSTEMEALEVQSLLEAGGIPAVVVGDSRFPNLEQHVRVPRDRQTEARRMIADALAVGPAGADEAEAASESPEESPKP